MEANVAKCATMTNEKEEVQLFWKDSPIPNTDYYKYLGKVDDPKISSKTLEKYHPYIQWWKKRTGIEQVTEEEISRCRTAYYALVDRMDKMIGEIINLLSDKDLLENTIVVYTSDHGEQLGENGLWWKQTFYENSDFCQY